jgi:hypothetical protein
MRFVFEGAKVGKGDEITEVIFREIESLDKFDLLQCHEWIF